jgi:SAM-dependent methyltransferase
MQYETLASNYDLIYSDKDYKSEVDYIISNIDEVSSIIDIGCGTGNHLMHYDSKLKLAGFDIEPEMLKVAKEKLPNITFYEDISHIPYRGYDLVTSMFNVVNHINSIEGLVSFFNNCYIWSNKYFVFDCWNGIAPYIDAPRSKTIKRDGNVYNIYSTLYPLEQEIELHTESNEYNNILKLRLWMIPTIKDILNLSGFKNIKVFKAFTQAQPLESDYKVIFICEV